MRKYETKACQQATLTVAVSDADRAELIRHAPHAQICAVPTGVDVSYFTPNGTDEKRGKLVFTGSMDWYPNEDAILHFIENILPIIQRQIAETSLVVVGRNPSRHLRNIAERVGVEVTGLVNDIRPYVAQASVYIVPLRVGGGTRLKIFEACAMGKAIVSTAIGAEGLPLVPGMHFIEANDSPAFAEEVVTLLRDPVRRRTIGRAARRLVEERYSWTSVARTFEARCKEAIHHAG